MKLKENRIYKDSERALKSRRYRLYKRILDLLNKGNCLFLTFTFNDETIANRTAKNRERDIRRFLNKQCEEYILNKDYGKDTEREHYHAIAKAKYKDFLFLKGYKMGYVLAEPINQLKRFNKNNDSNETIAKRLTEHATKNSTRNSKIIYSKPSACNKKINKYFKNKIDLTIERARKKTANKIYANRRLSNINKDNENTISKILKEYYGIK